MAVERIVTAAAEAMLRPRRRRRDFFSVLLLGFMFLMLLLLTNNYSSAFTIDSLSLSKCCRRGVKSPTQLQQRIVVIVVGDDNNDTRGLGLYCRESATRYNSAGAVLEYTTVQLRGDLTFSVSRLLSSFLSH